MQPKNISTNRYIDYDKALISALEDLPAHFWDFKEDDVREYTHGIHNYPAMMVCPISRNIIKLMKSIKDVDTLLDPFAGSGTVLVEGMLAGIKQILGTDINPLALFLCRVKTTRLDLGQLQGAVEQLYSGVDDVYRRYAKQIDDVDAVMQDAYHLDLTAKDGWGSKAPTYLEQYRRENQLDIDIPDFKNIGYWFKPRVILLLSILKREISKISDQQIRDFVFVAFSETIRFVSNRRNGEFKMFRMRAKKVAEFCPDVLQVFFQILNRNVEKMRAFDTACAVFDQESSVAVYRDNATTLQSVHDNSVDLVITSPPYGDSRTTVAYGEYSRLSLQWLNLFDLTEKEIMGIDKTLMGGDKYRKGFEYNISSQTLKESLEMIQKSDLERAGDVFSFYLDLEKAIAAISRKTKSGGYHFWVVGNRTVKGELLRTDKMISEIAEQYGMDYVYTVNRNIINKVMPSLNSPSNESGVKSSTMTNEHIVILRKQ